MKEVLARTKLKDSFTLVVSGSSANIQNTFIPLLYLHANRNYELAMVNLETYYSFADIRDGDNNSFKWSVDDIILGQFSTYLQDAMKWCWRWTLSTQT